MKNQKGTTEKKSDSKVSNQTAKKNPSTSQPKNNQSAKVTTVKIKFTKSPTGAFGLAYSIGDVVSINSKLANEVIKAKFAKRVK